VPVNPHVHIFGNRWYLPGAAVSTLAAFWFTRNSDLWEVVAARLF
jgi:hypothetical protein